MLDRVPKGAVMDADRMTPGRPAATVLHSDGRWYPATILAWCHYRSGWAALIRWPDGSEDWRRHDPKRLRPSVERLGSWDQVPGV
jgi:hypothetical protein